MVAGDDPSTRVVDSCSRGSRGLQAPEKWPKKRAFRPGPKHVETSTTVVLEESMKLCRRWTSLAVLLLAALAAHGLYAQAGPPFQTDDPTPVDLGHYEFYIFGMVDGTPAEIDSTGPAFEFNWGAVPDVQLHAILPFGAVLPSNNPIYAPGGTGAHAFGLTDTELGLKYGFIHQTKHRPQIGTFTMLELPTGNSTKGLGVGRVWYKLPLWMEKEFGPRSEERRVGKERK